MCVLLLVQRIVVVSFGLWLSLSFDVFFVCFLVGFVFVSSFLFVFVVV